MRSRNRQPRAMMGLVALIAFLSILASGCRPGANVAGTERSAVAEATAALLPTPTLAVAGTVDPLRPPTPVVLPSPTPQTGAAPHPTAVPGEPATGGVDSSPSAAPTVEVGTPPPTDVPLPEGATSTELLGLGQRAADEGDYVLAVAAFRAAIEDPGDLGQSGLAEASLGLSVALLAEGQTGEAMPVLESLAQSTQERIAASKGVLLEPANVSDIASFYLGQARISMGDYQGAIEAFNSYLTNNPDMAAYIQPLIADAYEALGDTDAVIETLASATDAPAQRFKDVANRGRLAALYLAQEDYRLAIEQYDAIHNIARTEATKGQMTYLAGLAEIMSGDLAAGYERFQSAITNYPRAAESYQALIQLIDAGIQVDEYQRGVVDFYAGAYLPAIEAFNRYQESAGDELNADAHLFAAWSHEALGAVDDALSEVEKFAAYEPARALFEQGEILRRDGRAADALAAYDAFLSDYLEADGAAGVAFAAASLADEQGLDEATERYLFLADTFPFDENTPRALYRAAELLTSENLEEAVALRRRLVDQYPANTYGAEALFRLIQSARSGEVEGLDENDLSRRVDSLTPSNYFALRAADLVAGFAPFTATSPMALPDDIDAGLAEAEAWLEEKLSASGSSTPSGGLSVLSGELADNPQRVVGEKLWQLGLLEEAKAELETVRETYAKDPLANYQMARYFSELGLYRSSIIAASALLRQVGATVYDAPIYLGRLAFPVYYADLIMPLAEQYGYDPRLQFALVRQESLFESFARSGAAAQGLSQVIPDTGAWIAQRLAWPEFENEDLYKPYVGLNFGAYYLSQQLTNFERHVHAALAAYNAGPGNAARWFDVAGADHDLFVDTVDFAETRLYIERIYEGFNAYRYLYGQP